MVNLGDRKIDADDVSQEDICSMAVELSDAIIDKLKEMDICTDEVNAALDNQAYDTILEYLEKLFDYPEYRHHN